MAEPEPAVLRLKDSVESSGSIDAPRGGRNRKAAGSELGDRVDAKPVSASPIDAAPAAAAAENASRPGRVASQEVKEVPRKSDPVSVFISRKTGRLYVRQSFEPLFDTPVTIRDPDVPLGTHLYTATGVSEDKNAMQWVAVTLTTQGAASSEVARNGGRRERGERNARHEHEVHATQISAATRLAAATALDRVEMPQEAIDRISELLSPGASLIISDLPLSQETGKYTDFIILTR